jgi:hypothetical protein
MAGVGRAFVYGAAGTAGGLAVAFVATLAVGWRTRKRVDRAVQRVARSFTRAKDPR